MAPGEGAVGRGPVVAAAVAVALAACTGSTAPGDADDASSDAAPTAQETSTPAASSSPTATPAPELRLVATGDPEVVFDWTEDACEPEHIPDIAARAFRDADGLVHLLTGHYVNHQLVGPSFDELVVDCEPVLRSGFDPDPSRFDDSEWIGSVWTEDGETVHAIVHNEYRGDTHAGARPGQCPSGDRFTCLDTSFTLAVSTDGGSSYTELREPPGHLLYTVPAVFDDEGRPTGLRQPSNLVEGPDGALYLFGNLSVAPAEQGPFEDQWVCLLRSDDLDDPSSWRYWDGDGFDGVPVDPYRTTPAPDAEPCQPVDPDLRNELYETVVFNEVLDAYLLLGIRPVDGTDGARWAVHASTSTDLLDWTPPVPVVDVPAFGAAADPEVDPFVAYLSLIDHDSDHPAFATMGDTAWLYWTRFHAGSSSLDRDLVRVPVALREVVPEPVAWTFDTDGDTEGWTPRNALGPLTVTGGALRTRSTGEDPYLGVGGLDLDAAFDTITIRLSATGGGTTSGELFFTTRSTPEGEATFLPFPTPVVADGTVRELVVDASTNPRWTGTITGLRLDPVADGDRELVIESIEVS